jgi:hypothetical protein
MPLDIPAPPALREEAATTTNLASRGFATATVVLGSMAARYTLMTNR